MINVAWSQFPTAEEYGDPKIQNEGDGPNVEYRTDNILITISSIEEKDGFSWDEFSCVRNPYSVFGEYFDDSAGEYDVDLLRTLPYAEDNAPNPFIDNHTFWFMFGCCGEVFCADDLDGSNVFEDNFAGYSCLEMRDVSAFSETSVWVDFLSQCENCHITGGDGGMWFKYEREFAAGQLSLFSSTDCVFGVPAEIEFRMVVECDAFEVYGCQDGELK